MTDADLEQIKVMIKDKSAEAHQLKKELIKYFYSGGLFGTAKLGKAFNEYQLKLGAKHE